MKKKLFHWMKACGLTLALFLSVSASATVYYVKPAVNGGDDAADGLSWETAFATIETGIETAVESGDAVYIMQGTYDRMSDKSLPTNAIRVEGGYTGVGTERVADPANTVWTGGNSRYFSGYGNGFYMSGITMTHMSGSFYGAIIQVQSTITFEDCIFSNITNSLNNSSSAGIRINNSNANVILNRCVFDNCNMTGSSYGGGAAVVFNTSGKLTVDNCVFKNNSGKSNGVIGRVSGTPNITIRNSLFFGNSAAPVSTTSGTANIYNCLFANNTKGVSISSGNVKNSIFYKTAATSGGSSTNCVAVDDSESEAYFKDETSWLPVYNINTYDAGTDDSNLSAIDYLGGSRKQGDAVDVGPYELIQVGAVAAGTEANLVGVTLNGEPVSEDGFYALYGDTLTVEFTKSSSVAACNIPGAVISTENDDCEAVILITESLVSVEVSSASPRTVTVSYPESLSNVSSTSGGSNPYTVAEGAPFVLTFTFDKEGYYLSTDAGEITGTYPDYVLTLESVTADVAVNITESIYVYQMDVAAGEGVVWDNTPETTASHGSTYSLSFSVGSGYHLPLAYVDGENYAISGSGPYSIELENVSADMTVVVGAYADNVLPVASDTYIDGQSSGTKFHEAASLYTSLSPAASYSRRALLKFDLTGAPAISGVYNHAELRMVPSNSPENMTEAQHPVVRTLPDVITTPFADLTHSNASGSVQDWGTLDGAVILADFPLTMTAGEPVSLDITNYVFANLSDDSILLAIDGTTQITNTRYHFYAYSLENGVNPDYVPQLVFSTAPVTGLSGEYANDKEVSRKYYSLQGMEIIRPEQGQIYVVKRIFESGKSEAKVERVRL